MGEVHSMTSMNRIPLLIHETPMNPLDPVLFKGEQLVHIKNAFFHLSSNLEPYLEATEVISLGPFVMP